MQKQHKDGFDFLLYPAASGQAKVLILFLHGQGDRPEGWAPYLQDIQRALPDADIISLYAPYHIPAGTKGLPTANEGYSWLPLTLKPLRYTSMAFTAAASRLPIATKVEKFVSNQLADRGLNRDKLAYMGFSMGAIISLQAGLSNKTPCAAVVSHAGAVFPFTKFKSKPPILLTMGANDEFFCKRPDTPKKGLKKIFAAIARPFNMQHKTTRWRLKNHGVPFQELIVKDLTHQTHKAARKAGLEFLVQSLMQKP